MSEPTYRVSNSAMVSEQLRAILALAEERGVLAITWRACRWLIEELERTPMEFGESREFLTHAELFRRIGFARPLYVHFAVHEPSRTVFIGRISWSERRRAE